jgi:hypothetical protein
MYDLTPLKHFELHFQPSYYVHYQEYNGSWYKSPWEIISQCKSIKRIQYNTQKYKKYIIIDIDNETENITDLPKPNFVVKNKFKNGKHLFYVLDRTITNEYYSKLWKEVQTKYSILWGGDICNTGYIGKNLYNDIDFEYIELETKEYNINYLHSFIKNFTETKTTVLKNQNTLTFSTKETKIETNLFGLVKTTTRNNDLFNELRFFAYSQIQKSVNDRDFIFIVETEAHKINEKFYNPLKLNEVDSTSKSVIKYCFKNRGKIKSKRGIMKLENDKTLKEKQKLGALYTAKQKNNKTEMKIKISIMEMKHQNKKINISTIEEYSKISRKTIRKYKEMIEEMIEEILLNDRKHN